MGLHVSLGECICSRLVGPGLGFIVPLKVDRIWGMWGSYLSIPKGIFYLLKRDYKPKPLNPKNF